MSNKRELVEMVLKKDDIKENEKTKREN